MDWQLRAAGVADCETVLPLVAAYHAFEGLDSDDATRRAAVLPLLESDTLGGIWLITGNGAVAGYAALCVGYSIEFGGADSFLDELFLLPEYRGQGGGKAALREIQAIARDRGIRALHLEVERENLPARALYSAAGLQAREQYVLMTVHL